jgi:hypothetical protein
MTNDIKTSSERGWTQVALAGRRKTEAAIDAFRLMRFVTTIDPFGLSTASEDRHDAIESAWVEAGLEPKHELSTAIKLWQGIDDTSQIIRNALDDYTGNISEEAAIAVATHQITVDTIAYAAQLSEKALRREYWRQSQHNRYVSGEPGFYDTAVKDPAYSRRFFIDDSIGAIIQNPAFDDSWESRHPFDGCPFAHGSKERPKIFDKFVKWAGTIAVREYYSNKD